MVHDVLFSKKVALWVNLLALWVVPLALWVVLLALHTGMGLRIISTQPERNNKIIPQWGSKEGTSGPTPGFLSVKQRLRSVGLLLEYVRTKTASCHIKSVESQI